MRDMKIIIRKSDSGYEIELSEEEVLALFQKLLEIINKNTEEQVEKTKKEFQDILDQFLGGSP
jgi:ABC-type Na+ transport system ATPase subunit NatA